ncbi:DUF418 domain-containing protein [Streptomyces sp. NPDC056486]|uniref:DUF418 domain-containing protein n=1 Tax=Streptomyces sp. NPDC056486 TaxID=3345835 RepID=UPI0036B0E585
MTPPPAAAIGPLPVPLSVEPAPPGSGVRLAGVDLARALAVFGLYAAYVGPDPSMGGVGGFLVGLAQGRAFGLFAFLAGFSVLLMTGRRTPKTGREGRRAVTKVVIRAVILLALGTALALTGIAAEMILAGIGVCLLLVLPLRRLGAGPLAALSFGASLFLPQLVSAVQRAPAVDDASAGAGSDLVELLLFPGSYSALTWIPYSLAGMAVARLDLSVMLVRIRLAVTGGVLALVGHGGAWLSTAAPHGRSTLAVLGNTGVALAVLVGCVAVTAKARPRLLLGPVLAVGAMSLTAYVFLIAVSGLPGGTQSRDVPLLVPVVFIGIITLFARDWLRHFERGPLESVLHGATRIADRIR